MKYNLFFLLICLLTGVVSPAQVSPGFKPGLLVMPVKLKNPYASGLVSSGRHFPFFRKSVQKGFTPAKKVASVKHAFFFHRSVRKDRSPLEYQTSTMGFEVRRYLHRHKVPPHTGEPSSITLQQPKPRSSGYYLGTDFFDQFAEPVQPGILPDYSTTGWFGSYSYKNRTYLTFYNSFGVRAEFGYLAIRSEDVVIDLAFKAGFQYVENNTDGLKFSDEARNLFHPRSTDSNANLSPSFLGSIRIGWTQ